MQKAKLLKLAAGLRSLTKAQSKHFNMGYWVLFDDKEVSKCNLNPQDMGCGTVACALGWATAFFPKSKLKFETNDWGGKCLDVIYKKKTNEFDDYPHGTEAGAIMFGLTQEESDYLFDPACYDQSIKDITPKFVAARIEKLVKTNGKSCQEYYEEVEAF